jgi:hypothetical protein
MYGIRTGQYFFYIRILVKRRKRQNRRRRDEEEGKEGEIGLQVYWNQTMLTPPTTI